MTIEWNTVALPITLTLADSEAFGLKAREVEVSRGPKLALETVVRATARPERKSDPVPGSEARGVQVRATTRDHNEVILEGLNGYTVYDRNRKAQDEDYRPLHPSTWLNQDRFLDDETVDLKAPRVSPLDKLSKEISERIGFTIQGMDKASLSECLSEGLTREQIMERLDGYKSDERLSGFLYKILEDTKGL